MLRTSLPLLFFPCIFVGYGVPATAQVGFGVRQTPVTTGGALTVAPVVTNGGTYVRMGISASFSQLVDVQTFSPVQNFPGLVPIAPIGFGGGFNQGFNAGFAGTVNGPLVGNNIVGGVSMNPKPTVDQFLATAKKFDKDENHRLDRKELSEVATAVIAELKRKPGFNIQRLIGRTPASGRRPAKPPTTSEIRKAFVARCLRYDRDGDESLDERETKRMAADLVRSLLA